MQPQCHARQLRNFFLSALTVLLVQNSAFPQEKEAIPRCEAVEGVLLLRGDKGKWQPVAAKQEVTTERLLVALFGADLVSGNGAVEMKLFGDIGQRGTFPVMESAVVLHRNPSFDADLTLARGIVVLGNRTKGPVKIRVGVLAEKFEITLPDGAARVGVEIFGRHLPGPANLDDVKSDIPVTNVFVLALAGVPVVTTEEKSIKLTAPPGTALLHWDSATRTIEARFLKSLPPAATALTADERKLLHKMCEPAATLAAKAGALGEALDGLLQNSTDANGRLVAVTAMAALDELPRVVQALNQAKYADARAQAVLVLRNWLGREPGQSAVLYWHLKDLGYTPVQARNFLHLLNGIDAAKQREPGTYDLLISALNHSKMPMRELAHWHLVRLAPAGKDIVYDAGADEARRAEAIAAWRRLIPEGELPPAPNKAAK